MVLPVVSASSPAATAAVMLRVQSVGKRFGGLAALTDVSFDVHEGELVGLVGPNGAGKSTLFNAIAGVFPPSEGRILLEDRDITGLPSHRLARQGLARTFQLVTLFSELSVLDNAVQALHRHRAGRLVSGLLQTRSYREESARWRERAREALALLSLEGLAEQPASSLPLGQAKLLAVAIALATEPRLLLLDEPAAGLSHEESSRMMDLISDRVRGRCSVVLVEHNMRIVRRYCDRAVVLQFGRKIFDGAPADMVNERAVVDAYLGTGEGA
ncbi:MAG: ABC transporter ATP-binding protein [Burkholderiaceae bacterium]